MLNMNIIRQLFKGIDIASLWGRRCYYCNNCGNYFLQDAKCLVKKKWVKNIRGWFCRDFKSKDVIECFEISMQMRKKK